MVTNMFCPNDVNNLIFVVIVDTYSEHSVQKFISSYAVVFNMSKYRFGFHFFFIQHYTIILLCRFGPIN